MKLPKPRKLKSGRWFAQTRINGKSYSVTEDTEKECLQRIMLIKATLVNGGDIAKVVKQPTLKEAITQYRNDRKNSLSASTYREYGSVSRCRFKSVQDTPINEIDNWQQLINHEATLVSAKTLKNAWGVVSPTLRYFHLPVPEIQLPQVIKNERGWLDEDELRIFLKAIEGNEYELGALLALHGLRRSEIFALYKKDIDMKKGFIRVEGAYVQGEDGFVLQEENKNQTSRRKVPIMIPRLKELLSLAPDGKLCNYHPDTLRSNIQKIGFKNDLGDIGTHSMRHTFCSLCFHMNIPAEQCMIWGGWKDLNTMNNIYKHISQADQNKYAERFTNFFKD